LTKAKFKDQIEFEIETQSVRPSAVGVSQPVEKKSMVKTIQRPVHTKSSAKASDQSQAPLQSNADANKTASLTQAIASGNESNSQPDASVTNEPKGRTEFSAPNTDVNHTASYLHNPKPDYPALAYRLKIQGEVILRVEVLENGLSGAVDLVRSSGHAMLDRAALDTVKNWKFKPAQRQGVAVRQLVEIPISFRLLNGQEDVIRSK
jgi:protein TonB